MRCVGVVAATGLLVVAVVHLELAPLHDSANTVITQGILFRGMAVAAAMAAVVATAATGGLLLTDRRHRALRESLGVFVLDRLDAEDRALLQRHLDRCADCRSEVDRLGPVVELLARTNPWMMERLVREETVVSPSLIPLPRQEKQPSPRGATNQ
jgi:hypothetical protein